MMKKYELTQNSIKIDNKTLYQIKALKDFGSVKKGDLGGYIESEKNLSYDGNCWVSGNAHVYGNALVSGNAQVSGNARVYESARVSGNAQVFESARVYGNARLGKVPVNFDCDFDPYKTLKEILNCPEILPALSGLNKNLDKLISTILTKTST